MRTWVDSSWATSSYLSTSRLTSVASYRRYQQHLSRRWRYSNPFLRSMGFRSTDAIPRLLSTARDRMLVVIERSFAVGGESRKPEVRLQLREFVFRAFLYRCFFHFLIVSILTVFSLFLFRFTCKFFQATATQSLYANCKKISRKILPLHARTTMFAI